jgi:hypothetical protein
LRLGLLEAKINVSQAASVVIASVPVGWPVGLDRWGVARLGELYPNT